MNERIYELINECTEQVDISHKLGMPGTTVVFNKEKFAELIIKETLQVARAGMEFGPSMDEAVYKYFGIKE